MGQSGGKLSEPPTGPIIDYTQMDRVRIAVNNGQYDPPEVDSSGNKTKPATNHIQKGTYAFRFPVVVPEIIDPWNVWVVSICSTNEAALRLETQTSCLTSRSPVSRLATSTH